MKSCEQKLPLASCHSERSEESYGAQGRLREGGESSPCANAEGDKKPQSTIDIFVIYDINLT